MQWYSLLATCFSGIGVLAMLIKLSYGHGRLEGRVATLESGILEHKDLLERVLAQLQRVSTDLATNMGERRMYTTQPQCAEHSRRMTDQVDAVRHELQADVADLENRLEKRLASLEAKLDRLMERG